MRAWSFLQRGGDTSGFEHAPPLGATVLLASLFVNILGLALPLSILQVYDRILPNNAGNTLFFLSVILFTAVVFEALLRLSRYFLLGSSASHTTQLATQRAVDQILGAKPTVIEKHEPSIQLERLEGLTQLNEYYGGQSRLYLIDAPFALLYLLLTFIIGGSLVLAPIATCVVFSGIILLIGRKLKRVLEDRSDNDRRRHDFIIDTLTGIHTIKFMAMEAFIERRFERLTEQTAQTVRRAIVVSTDVQAISNLFANITMVATVTYGALKLTQGSLSVGELASCTLLAGRAIEPFLKMLGLWTELQQVNLRRRKAGELLQLDQESIGETVQPAKRQGTLRIENLVYQFDDADKPLFDGLSLEALPGQIIGISGNDGSGKTTLVKLLRGELKPRSGRVSMDGYDIAGPQRRNLLQHVAYAPQRGVLFSGTIMENLTMFSNAKLQEQARRAARLIGLESDIHGLPGGYATRIAEGAALQTPDSFGQRIVIARALARQPDLLIFDEANAALDQRSDQLLLDGLKQLRGTMTLIIISNRPSYMAIADRAYALRDGRLVTYIPPMTTAQPAFRGVDFNVAS